MYDLCFCIVLYNKKVLESETIVSLLENFSKLERKISIVVYNNGPQIATCDNLPSFMTIHQVLINGSLSKIYNKTIELYQAEKYVFLDDDTHVNKDYLSELVGREFKVFLPKIHCNNVEYYPVINESGVQTITSGLAISHSAIENIKKLNGFIFDEAFDLYGIDTALCYFINKNSYPYTISDVYLEHELSHISGSSSEFRRKEVLLANSAALIRYFNMRLLLQTGYSVLWAIKKNKIKILWKAFLSFISGKVIR